MKKTRQFFDLLFGKLDKTTPSHQLEESEISDVKNMEPSRAGWIQRKGISELTTTSIEPNTEIKNAIQFRQLNEDANEIIAHTYDPVNGERIMKQATLPPTTHTGASWSELKTLTAGCEVAQFAIVGDALVMANGKEIQIYRGPTQKPYGVYFYDDSNSAYIDWYDELTDADAATEMVLDSMTTSDYFYVIALQPLEKVTPTITAFNANASELKGEYFNGGWTELLRPTGKANTLYADDDCSDISGWTDGDAGTGVSSQVTFDGEETFKFTNGASTGAGHYAYRWKDHGSFGDTVVLTMRVYNDAIGTKFNNDYMEILISNASFTCAIGLADDNLRVYNGHSWNNVENIVGDDLVDEDVWTEWTFVIDFAGSPTNTVDIYKDGAKVGGKIDCHYVAGNNGVLRIYQYGYNTSNNISYVSNIRIGDDLESVGHDFVDGTSPAAVPLGTTMDDDFTGDNDDPPDPSLWTDLDSGGVSSIQSNKLNMLRASGAQNLCRISALEDIPAGDFDVRIDYELITYPATNGHWHGMTVQVDADNFIRIFRRYGSGSHQYVHMGEEGGTPYAGENEATADTSGTLRIVRYGPDTRCFYWDGDKWNQIGSYVYQITTGAITLLYVQSYGSTGNPATEVNFDNFRVVLSQDVSGEKTHSQQGDIEWTPPSDEITTFVNGQHGYCYRFSVDSALDANVRTSELGVYAPWNDLKNIWGGEYLRPIGCLVYDGADYEDYTGKVNNDFVQDYVDLSDLTTANGKFYLAFSEPVSTIVLHIDAGRGNDNAAVATVKYKNNAGAWSSGFTVAGGTLVDTTNVGGDALKQSGYLQWSPPTDEKPTVVGGELTAKYWYEVSFSADLDGETWVYFVEAVPALEHPDYSVGVFAYKRRVMQIAPKGIANTVRYSAAGLANVFNGNDAGYIYYGERPLKAAIQFFNEALVFADREMWMTQGDNPASFGKIRLSNKVGIDAPDSLVSVELGVLVGTGASAQQRKVICWVFRGLMMFDGVRWWKISSPDIDNFFDPDSDDFIDPDYADRTFGAFDFESELVYWTIHSGPSQTTPNKVLVFHPITLWYGIYEYDQDVRCILTVANQLRTYLCAGGHSTGKLYRVNHTLTDVDATGTAVAIEAYVITRDIWAAYDLGLKQRLIFLGMDAQEDGGQVQVYGFPDASKTEQEIGRVSMIERGKDVANKYIRVGRTWPGEHTTKLKFLNESSGIRWRPYGAKVDWDPAEPDSK